MTPGTNIDRLLITPQTSILQAMQVIELAPHLVGISGIAIVVDDLHPAQRHLLGVVTDGDIRSAILRLGGAGSAGKPAAEVEATHPRAVDFTALEATVETIMTRDPIAVTNRSNPLRMYETVMELLRERSGGTRMLDRGAGKVVVVDEAQRVVDVISLVHLWQQADIKTRRVAVLGLGFVGLTLAVVLADAGFKVLGIEAQPQVVEMLQRGEPHFYEAGLANQLRTHIGQNMQVAERLPADGRLLPDIYIVSVGTPVDAQHQPVMTYVEEACRSIGRVLKRGDTVMLRSTVPVGTTRHICLPILEQESGLQGGQDFSLVFAPERTIAGKALKELRTLPQIVGALDPQGAEIAAALYREITPAIILLDSLEEAEMVKLVNNTFRDTIFSFANEIALVCERYNLDANKIIHAANEGYPRDPIPLPSPGVGGVCLKKDPYLLQATAQARGFDPQIIGRSRAVNEYMPRHVVEKFLRFCRHTGKEARQARVLVVGFAFKGWPETSDMRDSATLELVRLLQQDEATAGVQILGYDPVVTPQALDQIAGVASCTLVEGFKGADCVFVMNNHPSYENWNLQELLEKMHKPALFLDGWSMFRLDEFTRIEGVHYSSLSRDDWVA